MHTEAVLEETPVAHALEPAWGSIVDTLLQDALATSEVDDVTAGPAVLVDPGLADAVGRDARLRTLLERGVLPTEALNALAVLLALELDGTRRTAASTLHRGAPSGGVTLAALLRLATAGQAGAWADAIAPDGVLRRTALVRVAPGRSWSDTAICASSELVWWYLGTPLSLEADVGRVVALDVRGAGSADLALVSGRSRLRRLQAAVGATAAPAYVVLESAPTTEAGWSHVVAVATLQGVGIVLDAPGHLDLVQRAVVERADHLTWAICSPDPQWATFRPRRPWVEVEAREPTATPMEVAAVLGDDVRFSEPLVDDLETSLERAQAGIDLGAALRDAEAARIGAWVDRRTPRTGWEDLVVDDACRDLLAEIVTRVRHRDRAAALLRGGSHRSCVTALFSGPSGTGKTLAAEVVAGELGVDLLQVDLSQVVDKYIGETEKHIAEIFDAATHASAVLFFDEADALIGKRTEVRDSHDRSANLQVAYLLQRIEQHSGVVLLATNFPGNIDVAFQRRIAVSVSFAKPVAALRRTLWEHYLPTGFVADDVSLDLLAERLEVTGSQVRNIATRATFLALEADATVDLATIVTATSRELGQSVRALRLEDVTRPTSSLSPPTPGGSRAPS